MFSGVMTAADAGRTWNQPVAVDHGDLHDRQRRPEALAASRFHG
ncbi:hypothetical protein [Herbidospora mongoliensis]|nr:hypothetical protein [Herbidospora mongoliensis]